MGRCRTAESVLIGGFVNAAALTERLAARERIALVCAGSDGDVTRDDVLFAGLMVERLQRRSRGAYRLNGQAITARDAWLAAFPKPTPAGMEKMPPAILADQLRKSIAGQKLVAIGMEDDLFAAAQLDQFDLVPELDMRAFRIRVP
jgi:2-phosphosulfolactate phosphatase